VAHVEVGGLELAEADSDELARIWGEVFSTPPWNKPVREIAAFESERLLVHARRPGFAIAIARNDLGIEGFAYGHTGQRDTWWPQYLRERLGEPIVDEWVVGQFEFIELVVRESARGAGTGRHLIEELLASRHESRVVMQTRDEDLPARRLYTSLGFLPLRSLDDDVLLGRELPIR
jgi:ribosomal protein S18 acetylase RimI-like enzyme